MKTQPSLFPFLLVASALLSLVGCAAAESEDSTEDNVSEDSDAVVKGKCSVTGLSMSTDANYLYAKVKYAAGGGECGFLLTAYGPGGLWIPDGSASRVSSGSGTLSVKTRRSDFCASRTRQMLPNGKYIVTANASAQGVPGPGALERGSAVSSLSILCK